jgi:hypothetical protein
MKLRRAVKPDPTLTKTASQPRWRLVRVSRTSVADEMRIEHTQRVLGD